MVKKTAFNVEIIILTLLPFFLFLHGCSFSHRDGPPDFYVDETRIPNAVPKAEPLSRIGNSPTYSVGGKRYYVLRSSKDFVERGIASWYGTRFDRQRTSNGERYNMLAMTAAHKNLPLPTYLEVTNLENGRKIIVKVNDRGPFKPNRVIDLSYVGAKKLGMLGRGTAYVQLRAINPRGDLMEDESIQNAKVWPFHLAKSLNKKPQIPANIFIQVGSFAHKKKALKLRDHLVHVYSIAAQVHYAHKLYSVTVGPLANLAKANLINKKLIKMGFKPKRVPVDVNVI